MGVWVPACLAGAAVTLAFPSGEFLHNKEHSSYPTWEDQLAPTLTLLTYTLHSDT